MVRARWLATAATVIAAAVVAGAAPLQRTPADPLQLPAAASAIAVRSPLFAIARAGTRLVVVGQRGHILTSDDSGVHWQQAEVPVSTDLVAVHFPSATQGWAVGHDGVILHSSDGGRRWQRQLDGRQVAALMEQAYAPRARSPEIEAALAEARRMQAEGPDLPFLDVWFTDERNGYAVGAFNLVFSTSDGGAHWQPASDRLDNPKGRHLYGIRSVRTTDAAGTVSDQLYIAGELGLLLRLDPGTQRFTALPTPYPGTWFGLLATPDLLLAYGLRGNAWSSRDAGRSWQQVATGVQTGLTGAALLDDGRIALVSQGGQLLLSRDHAASFARVDGVQPLPLFAVSTAGPNALALAGSRGVRIETLK
ncbi:WD40/YVTN/BNR-like repeat-containing protein [Aquabacterium sp.]|uniref:WD40/YVTN/BNR-like repeat-containing protein n=1 Tax=Aquabacterium sp. TaxID=1872578 RepID=UPI002C4C6AEF|nr:YCF48-related protein [Aquabacterium sp.]HSW03556.1 YCF48-related protein [Aquabacterium sp.]